MILRKKLVCAKSSLATRSSSKVKLLLNRDALYHLIVKMWLKKISALFFLVAKPLHFLWVVVPIFAQLLSILPKTSNAI